LICDDRFQDLFFAGIDGHDLDRIFFRKQRLLARLWLAGAERRMLEIALIEGILLPKSVGVASHPLHSQELRRSRLPFS
jgi:hypothetical protein